MKKLYLSITLFFMFILMFAITMIPTKAYTFNGDNNPLGLTLDTPLIELDNLSLRNVFGDFNEIQNGNFSNGSTNWTGNSITNINVSDGYLTYNPTSRFPRLIQTGLNLSANDVYFGLVRRKISDYTQNNVSELFLHNGTSAEYLVQANTVLSNDWYAEYGRVQNTNNNNQLWIYNTLSTTWQTNLVLFALQDVILINLTYLNLENLTDEELYYYFNIYYALRREIDITSLYNQGYEQGEDVGYLDGYNDGLVEGYYDGNNAYHQGIYEFDYLTGVPYLEGLETGYNNGVDYAVQENISILSIFELIFGVALNMLTFIITIDIFGISILSLISVLSLFVGVVWILKMIRG